MKRFSIAVMVAMAALLAPVSAQQDSGAAQTTTAGSGQGQGQGRGTNTVVNPIGRSSSSLSMTNVRLELTITDQSGGGQPIKKVITLLLADGGSGRVRSSSNLEAPNANATWYQVSLNADARIWKVDGDRIRTNITVEYAPAAQEGTDVARRGSPLNQTVDVVLINGKSTVIVQASDPLTDRKVTLDATATIVR
ncbi:MAG: hypothetical protein M3R55_05490 [Acidobacteriota bacterium]|nr:hypothetical protein [Acidobacteriota bacterium]